MTTVTLQDGLSGYTGTRDTYMSDYSKTTNYGTNADFYANFYKYTPLIRFAIFESEGGPVPDGATINSATLYLYKYSNYSTDMTLNRVLRDWTETGATWNNWKSGSAWTTARAASSGNDIEGTSYATYSNSNFGTNTWGSADVTTDVSAWAGGTANYGWRALVTSSNNERKFWSRNYSTDATLRPYLVIDYTASSGITGTLTATLGNVTLASAGTLALSGSAAVTLGNVTTTATGSVSIHGAAAITLGAVTSSATGSLALSGAAAISLGDVTAAATGSLTNRGALAATLGAVTLAATGGSTNTGQVAVTLGDVTTTSAASLSLNATLGGTLGAVALAATGSIRIAGSLAQTLDNVTLASTGVLGSTVTGQAAITLGNVTLASTGTLALSGAVGATLGNVTLSATGRVSLAGSAAITLGNVTSAAAGSVAIRGAMLATLGNVTLTAMGGLDVPTVDGPAGYGYPPVWQQIARPRSGNTRRLGSGNTRRLGSGNTRR